MSARIRFLFLFGLDGRTGTRALSTTRMFDVRSPLSRASTPVSLSLLNSESRSVFLFWISTLSPL